MEHIDNYTGKKVIIRADRAGVFFGTLAAKEGSEVKLTNCRRIWRWDGAASLSELALSGVATPDGCYFSVTVASIVVLGVIEIIPCTEKAVASIEAVPVWKMSK